MGPAASAANAAAVLPRSFRPGALYFLDAGVGRAYLGGRVIPYALEAGRSGRRNSTALYLTNGIWQEAPIDGTRRGDNGDLIEASATNLLLWSEDFTNVNWQRVRATPVPNTDGVINPNGNTATKLLGSADNASHFVSQNVTLTGDRVISVHAKAAELSWLILANTAFNTNVASFDLSTGAVGTVSGFTDTKIEALADGWYRCSAAIPAALADDSFDCVIALGEADNTFGFAGAADEGIYIDAAQFEAGSRATSYIPTEGSSATRAADTLIATQGRGDELLTNGSFDADSYWTKFFGATISGGVLTLTGDDTSFPRASQDIDTQVGATYEITYDFIWSGTQGIVRAGTTSVSSQNLNHAVNNSSLSTGKTVTFVATEETTRISFWLNSTASGTSIQFDNVSVRRVLPTPDWLEGPKTRFVQSPGANADLIDASITSQTINDTLELITCQAADDWTPSGIEEFVGQWGSGNSAYVWRLQASGVISLYLSSNGTDFFLASSTEEVYSLGVSAKEHVWLRALVNIPNNTVTFYSSLDPVDTPFDAVVWTVLGTADRAFSGDITSGVFASSSNIQVGGRTGVDCFTGKTYRALAYYDGVLKWDMNPAKITAKNQTSFVADTGEEWTAQGNATLEYFEGMDGAGWLAFDFEVPSQTADANRYIFQMDDGSVSERALVFLNNGGIVQLGGQDAVGGYSSVNAVEKVQPGTRHRLAVAYTETGLKMSLDGAAVVSVSRTLNPELFTHLRLGHTVGGTQQLDGALAEAQTGSGTKTDAELQELVP